MGPMLAPWTLLSGSVRALWCFLWCETFQFHLYISFRASITKMTPCYWYNDSHYNLRQCANPLTWYTHAVPDSRVHGTNVGPTWGRQDPGGPHVGPMNYAIWGSVVWGGKKFMNKSMNLEFSVGSNLWYSSIIWSNTCQSVYCNCNFTLKCVDYVLHGKCKHN